MPAHDRTPPYDAVALQFTGSLRDAQRAVVDATLPVLRNETGAILNLPCGMGKTVIALQLAALLGAKTLILLHKEFLVQQWRERIAQFLPAARTGLIQGRTFDVDGKDVVLATVQTIAMKADITRSRLDGFGLLVADECHHLGAEVFSRALHKARPRYTLGLSATVARKDGLSKVFIWHLGRISYAVAPRKDAVVQVDVAAFAPDDDDDPYHDVPTLGGSTSVNFSAVINNVCACAARSRMIAARASAVLRESPARKVLVLSDRLAHLHALQGMLEELGVPLDEVGYYVGGRKPADLADAAARRVIMGTYAMASEGMDIPDLNALVLASPKSDVVQSVGRILRLAPADRELTPLVVDVRDVHPVVQGAYRQRRKFYRKCGFTMRGDTKR
jgi:superfamily II DNA or RNA helicase